jgi:hypothetical protein
MPRLQGIATDCHCVVVSVDYRLAPETRYHGSLEDGDDPICACAETGRADFIVKLNPKDFPQRLLSAHVIKPGDDVPMTARRKPRQRV